MDLAHANRTRWLAHYMNKEPGRLRGLEELLKYLESVREIYAATPDLNAIRFLIERVGTDFDAAVEAAFSGSRSACFDLMRDVMETELLLRDFAGDPSTIRTWLDSDESTRREFWPGELRKRIAARLWVDVRELLEFTDYAAHSRFLHVNPEQNPFADRGIEDVESSMRMDMCFWEMFEHARRFVFSAYELAVACDTEGVEEINPEVRLSQLRAAWELSQSVQSIYLTLLGERSAP